MINKVINFSGGAIVVLSKATGNIKISKVNTLPGGWRTDVIQKTYVNWLMMYQCVTHFNNLLTLFTVIISNYVFVINMKCI